MKINYRQQTSGFTLIEMIVSLAVFSIVVTTAVGAMLVLIATNQRLQAEQSVMTNLAFALDTMTREMRTGYSYVCAGVNNINTPVTGLTPSSPVPRIFNDSQSEHEQLGSRTRDCSGGRNGARIQGVSFIEGGDSITSGVTSATRILYFYDEDDRTIYRRVGNGVAQSIVSSGLYIENAEFVVTSSTTGDNEQPTITVYIEAREKDSVTDKIYRLQTTVTQRILDL